MINDMRGYPVVVEVRPRLGEPVTAGAYLVQYGDEAQKQFERLPAETQSKIKEMIDKAAAINPSAHGLPEDSIRDRLRLRAPGVSALVWVSREVKVLTVAEVREEPSPEED